ncbi:MAG: riboflavin biosynthesis protein RibF, partial [Oscillospiraceae bacterium]|nr:riboflavin biosynthesis protein RibF [Oscillospiraceae bacterium]
DCRPAVLSFDTHPDKMVSGKEVWLINSPFDRAEYLRRSFDINDLIFLHFDDKLRHMAWQDFIDWMVNDFNAVHFVCGYDYRFGFKGQGNVDRLRERCGELGLGCDVIEKFTYKGEVVSSTLIRKLLTEGEIEKANEYLGHPYAVSDIVRVGYKLGRTIGIPTINMWYNEGVLIPKKGVYAARVFLENGEEHMAITNIGTRPTVSGSSVVSIESHILDYEGNLYGTHVRVELYHFIRPERKFDSIDALREQIQRDIVKTRQLLS